MIDLRFDQVSKKYRIRQSTAAPGLRGKFGRLLGAEFWAVKDVSFEVKRGESLGIIGHNGAGKSTILKLLSSITAPTAGTITINGRLSALLEVGSGFHPELTGRENVFLSGAILGMRRNEIAGKLDDIVSFAEIQQFIDVPVKRYSSGMYVRLGFAIAAHLEPDILLLDEVLAVGDAAFQDKCIERVLRMKASGTTIVFISHDLSAVGRLCGRVLLMKQGSIVASGTAAEMIGKYRETAFVPSRAHEGLGRERGAEITFVEFLSPSNTPTTCFTTGEGLKVRVRYTAHRRIPRASIGVFFYPAGKELACQFSTSNGADVTVEPGDHTVEFFCPDVGLQPGFYNIDVAIEQRGEMEPIDWHAHCATISVEAGRVLRGSFLMPHTWQGVDEHRDALVEKYPADNRV